MAAGKGSVALLAVIRGQIRRSEQLAMLKETRKLLITRRLNRFSLAKEGDSGLKIENK